jgi:hypothetical protein
VSAIRHDTQLPHHQNSTRCSNKTAHKATQTIKETLQTMNEIQIQFINIKTNTLTINKVFIILYTGEKN